MRRQAATFLLTFLATLLAAVLMGQQAANAWWWSHGSSTVSCVTVPYEYPQYGIVGVISKCGGSWHEPGWW